MGLKKGSILTIANPSTFIKNELTLTNNDEFNLHAYLHKKSDFTTTESGQIMFNKKPRSNLSTECDKILNKQCKEIPGCNVLVGYKNGVYKKMYTDGYGMFFGSKIEDYSGVSCNIRADVVAELVRKGIIPVQCREGTCMAAFPNKLSLDYTRFAVKQPIRKV